MIKKMIRKMILIVCTFLISTIAYADTMPLAQKTAILKYIQKQKKNTAFDSSRFDSSSVLFYYLDHKDEINPVQLANQQLADEKISIQNRIVDSQKKLDELNKIK